MKEDMNCQSYRELKELADDRALCRSAETKLKINNQRRRNLLSSGIINLYRPLGFVDVILVRL